jgi:NitT/TauT family transport system substrate-binding protein
VNNPVQVRKSLVAKASYLILFGCVITSVACQQRPTATTPSPTATPSRAVTLRMPDTHFMGLLPLYIADEKGFFSEEGIRIQWIDVRDPGQAGKLFFAGQADILVTTFASIMPAEVRKPGTLRLLLPAYEAAKQPGSFLLVRKGSSISSVAGLRGKKVGTYSGPSQRAYAQIALNKMGLRTPQDVQLIQVASSAQIQGLFGGGYDALFTVEPYGSTAISQGARVLETGVRTKYISDPFWVGAVALPASRVSQNPQEVQALSRALEKAVRFIEKNETEARGILARRGSLTEPVAKRCALYTWVASPTSNHIAQVQSAVDTLLKAKIIERSVKVDALFDAPVK